MKRWIAILLVLALSLVLFGCGKNEMVKAVEAQIDALGTVTYEDKAEVEAARNAYEALLENDREKVENLETLALAEATLRNIQQEIHDEADRICSNNGPYEALPQLRQLPQTAYVQVKIHSLAYDLVKSYVLAEGVISNSIGDPEVDGNYMAINLQVYGEKYYFSAQSDGQGFLTFAKREGYPTNHMVKDGYTLYERATRIYYMGGGMIYYHETEYFRQNYDYFNVSLDVDVDPSVKGQDLSRMPAELECDSFAHWPYVVDIHDMEESATVDVEDFVEEMNDCLEALGLPATAWEVLDIWE